MGGDIVKLCSDNTDEADYVVKKRAKAARNSVIKLRKAVPHAQRKVEPIMVTDTDACTSIWQSVVVQAFYDVISEAKDNEQKLHCANAIAWFGLGMGSVSEPTDLEIVCDLAGLNIHEVLKLSRRAIRGDVVNGEKIISGFNFRRLRKNISSRRNKRV